MITGWLLFITSPLNVYVVADVIFCWYTFDALSVTVIQPLITNGLTDIFNVSLRPTCVVL
jgi:hypothetical protein